MARRPSTSQSRRFSALIAQYEAELQRAFNDAIASIRGALDWPGLIAALERGDVDGAVAAIGIETGDFLALWQKANEAYIAGATATVETLTISGLTKGEAASIRFDMTNPRAEAYMTTDTARMVQQVSEDSKQAVREAIQRGYQAGRGPRDIATDVAGRVVGGQRQGGIVGLDTGRAHRFDMVSQGMRTPEGVQDLVIRHRDGTLGLRYKVNASTEKAILSAYRKGTAVPDATRIRSENQFRNALLKSRADTIARTETGQAVAAGREEEWRQTLEKLGRDPSEVVKTWQSGNSADPRPSHRAANNMQVTGIDTPFILNDGGSLRFPHDPAAHPSQTINCGCGCSFRLPTRKEDLL